MVGHSAEFLRTEGAVRSLQLQRMIEKQENMKVECRCCHDKCRQATLGIGSCPKGDSPHQKLSLNKTIKIYILQEGFEVYRALM